MTLLWVALILIIGGFLLNLYGTWLQYRQPGATDPAPSLPDLLAEAVRRMLTSLTDALDFSLPIWRKWCAFGSVLAFLGAAVFIVWVIQSVTAPKATT